MNNKPRQFYWFTMILYPENRAHLQFVQKVLPNLPLRAVGIKHDKDSLIDDEILLRLFNQQATVVNDQVDIVAYAEQKYKKEHIHLVFKVPAKRTLQGMREIIATYGVEERFIQSCDPYNMMAYLTHKNAPQKFQYSDDDVFGDIGMYTEYTTNLGNQEFCKFYQLMSVIDTEVKNGNLECNYSSFCYYIFANGLGHLLTGKGNFMYNTIIKEKIKEIKNYGLHYTIPHYGKIDI